jgi:hypothetical protein
MPGAAFVQTDVVQQRRRADDVGVGSLGACNPIGQVYHPQDVIKIVGRIGIGWIQ